MTASLLSVELMQVRRQFRLIALLDAAEKIALTPLGVGPVHTVAYLTDALAPVWGLPIIDGQILKQNRPYYPTLQADLDHLVGIGIVEVSSVQYLFDNGRWRLEGNYSLYRPLADRILSAALALGEQSRVLKFVHEVVFATSGLGLEGLRLAAEVDATYSDPSVDVGGVLDVERDNRPNPSVEVALRFGDLLGTDSELSTAEMVNLYVRQLYTRMQQVA